MARDRAYFPECRIPYLVLSGRRMLEAEVKSLSCEATHEPIA